MQDILTTVIVEPMSLTGPFIAIIRLSHDKLVGIDIKRLNIRDKIIADIETTVNGSQRVGIVGLSHNHIDKFIANTDIDMPICNLKHARADDIDDCSILTLSSLKPVVKM